MAEPEGWTKHPAGQTQVFPVTGWQTGRALEGQAGVVRIEFALDPGFKKRDARQLIMNESQLRALSETLAKLADTLQPAKTPPRQ